MIKFTNANRSPLYIATDEQNKQLYSYTVDKYSRTIKKLTVYDKSVDTFELPPFKENRSDQNINNVLLKCLGWPLYKYETKLLDKYLSGTIKIAEGCFDDLKDKGIKKVTLKVSSGRYSIYLNGGRNKNTYFGAFNGDIDVTLKLPKNLMTFNVEKTFAVRTEGKNVPGMHCSYTLIADKRLGKISEFDTTSLNDPDNSVSQLYDFQQCRAFPIEYYDPRAKEIENS